MLCASPTAQAVPSAALVRSGQPALSPVALVHLPLDLGLLVGLWCHGDAHGRLLRRQLQAGEEGGWAAGRDAGWVDSRQGGSWRRGAGEGSGAATMLHRHARHAGACKTGGGSLLAVNMACRTASAAAASDVQARRHTSRPDGGSKATMQQRSSNQQSLLTMPGVGVSMPRPPAGVAPMAPHAGVAPIAPYAGVAPPATIAGVASQRLRLPAAGVSPPAPKPWPGVGVASQRLRLGCSPAPGSAASQRLPPAGVASPPLQMRPGVSEGACRQVGKHWSGQHAVRSAW